MTSAHPPFLVQGALLSDDLGLRGVDSRSQPPPVPAPFPSEDAAARPRGLIIQPFENSNRMRVRLGTVRPAGL